ncbi:MAG TPA: fused MFS/spermidine synthase, partial [Streptosporangiaceae bacterium]
MTGTRRLPSLGHQRRGTGPDGGRPGAASPVELAGDPGRPRAWMLLAGGVPQSHVDLDEPRHLELEYMRRLGHLVDLAAPAGMPLRVLHLGGGGLTLARYVAATRPGSRQLAAESDAEVAELVRRRLPLDQPLDQPVDQPGRPRAGNGGIAVRVADARAVLEQVPAGSFDLVIADVFAGNQTPAHLTSVEFTAAAARALATPGIYAANIADG